MLIYAYNANCGVNNDICNNNALFYNNYVVGEYSIYSHIANADLQDGNMQMCVYVHTPIAACAYKQGTNVRGNVSLCQLLFLHT